MSSHIIIPDITSPMSCENKLESCAVFVENRDKSPISSFSLSLSSLSFFRFFFFFLLGYTPMWCGVRFTYHSSYPHISSSPSPPRSLFPPFLPPRIRAPMRAPIRAPGGEVNRVGLQMRIKVFLLVLRCARPAHVHFVDAARSKSMSTVIVILSHLCV